VKEQAPKKFFVRHILRKIFLEDWAMKLIALVITLGLWLGVTGLSTPTTKRFTVPLNLNIASNAQIVNVPRGEVDIEISGDKRKIEQINRSDLVASVDLTDVEPGNRVLLLSPDTVYVPLPQGIKLLEVTPGSIPINLEAVEEKEFQVTVKTSGKPATGFEIYDEATAAVPALIRVRGPASVVKTLEFVQTDPVDVDGRKDNFTARQVNVNASDPKAAVLNTVVDVFVRIGEKRIERSFTVPVMGLGGKTASFTIFGPRTLVQKLKTEDLKVQTVRSDTGEETPQVILPGELQDVVTVKKLRVSP
jgi:YbbR domain-containing protein